MASVRVDNTRRSAWRQCSRQSVRCRTYVNAGAVLCAPAGQARAKRCRRRESPGGLCRPDNIPALSSLGTSAACTRKLLKWRGPKVTGRRHAGHVAAARHKDGPPLREPCRRRTGSTSPVELDPGALADGGEGVTRVHRQVPASCRRFCWRQYTALCASKHRRGYVAPAFLS